MVVSRWWRRVRAMGIGLGDIAKAERGEYRVPSDRSLGDDRGPTASPHRDRKVVSTSQFSQRVEAITLGNYPSCHVV